MLNNKSKTMTFSFRMCYDGIMYSRVEKRNYDFESESWSLDEICWNHPDGLRIATINNEFIKPTALHFSKEVAIDNEILFSKLEREYKLSSLDI